MRRRFIFATLMVATATATLAAPARPASAKRPPVIPAPVVQSRPTPAPVTNAGRVDDIVRAAGEYLTYQQTIAQMNGVRLDGSASLDTAVSTAGRADPNAAGRGLVPYLALIAAQEPAFVDGVRAAARLYGRDNLIRGFQGDTSYAAKIPGAEAALTVVRAALLRDAAQLNQIGNRFTRDAYTIQKSSWSQGLSPKNRNQSLKSAATSAPTQTQGVLEALAAPHVIGSAELATALDRVAQFWAATGQEKPTQKPAIALITPTQTAIANAALSLAALRVLNGADPRNIARPAVLQNCMEMSRLQLYQCFSAGKYKYEEPFCLGRHALSDPAKCMGGS